MKNGKFAINIDTRHGDSTFELFKDLFNFGWNKYYPSAWFLRKVFETAENYT